MANTFDQINSWDEFVLESSPDHKAVTAIALDRGCSNMVTGGVDGVLNFWDFPSVSVSSPRPTQQLIPLAGHSINALSFNSSNALVLSVSSDAKARIFRSDGNSNRPIEETVKGDQYIRTPENTQGHTHMLSCGSFHPLDSERFMTGSYDSTVRLWNLQTKKVGMDQNLPNLNCFKCTDYRGVCGGTGMYVTSASYSPDDGCQVIAGCSDGSVQLFHEKYKSGKAIQIARIGPKGPSDGLPREITDVQFHQNFIIARSMDNFLRGWDLRFLRKSEPIFEFSNIETVRSSSSFDVSPTDANLILLGTSSAESVLLNISTGTEIGRKKISSSGIVKTIWRNDQIFQTTTDGNVFVYSDPSAVPHRGVRLMTTRAVKPIVAPSRQIDNNVYSFDDLIESGKFRENRNGDVRAIKESTKPPVQRSQLIEESFGSNPDAIRAELERRKKNYEDLAGMQDRLLAHGSTEDSSIISGAYAQTQPRAVIDYSVPEGAAENLLKKKQYCPRCGLKICTCGYLRSLEQAAKRFKAD